jgi:putative DNA-invertase from lambdoid prophage Rac
MSITADSREFMRRGVIIKTVINGMTFDGATTDPMQQAARDALIAFMAASAQVQAEATMSAQRAGIARSRMVKPRAYLGARRHTSGLCSSPLGLLRQPAEPIGHRQG